MVFEDWEKIITNAQKVSSQMGSSFWKDKPELNDA